MLRCHIDGHPRPTGQWFRDGSQLLDDRSSYSISNKERTLTLKSASPDDNGVYSCCARNAVGTVCSHDNFTLSIFGEGPRPGGLLARGRLVGAPLPPQEGRGTLVPAWPRFLARFELARRCRALAGGEPCSAHTAWRLAGGVVLGCSASVAPTQPQLCPETGARYRPIREYPVHSLTPPSCSDSRQGPAAGLELAGVTSPEGREGSCLPSGAGAGSQVPDPARWAPLRGSPAPAVLSRRLRMLQRLKGPTPARGRQTPGKRWLPRGQCDSAGRVPRPRSSRESPPASRAEGGLLIVQNTARPIRHVATGARARMAQTPGLRVRHPQTSLASSPRLPASHCLPPKPAVGLPPRLRSPSLRSACPTGWG
ncbi:uncharacterized protein LOC142824244, partial [Pelodiscus sinensis]|uniref:uncharacterized protein LOC142824244 n=1 Tax=Pelodiscus sinensis TaxID=13735 RepID=UPI003F6BE4CD